MYIIIYVYVCICFCLQTQLYSMIGNKFTHEFERASFRLEGGRGGIHHFSFLLLSNGGKAGFVGSFSG